MIDKDNEIHLLKAQVLYWQQKYEKLKMESENIINQKNRIIGRRLSSAALLQSFFSRFNALFVLYSL